MYTNKYCYKKKIYLKKSILVNNLHWNTHPSIHPYLLDYLFMLVAKLWIKKIILYWYLVINSNAKKIHLTDTWSDSLKRKSSWTIVYKIVLKVHTGGFHEEFQWWSIRCMTFWNQFKSWTQLKLGMLKQKTLWILYKWQTPPPHLCKMLFCNQQDHYHFLSTIFYIK